MPAPLPHADVAVSPGPPHQQEAVRRQIPSLRNREVFAAVAMGKSHAQVALAFGLTQPRVTQIVRQVREWSTQVAGGELGEYNEIQRLRLAEETLRVQLDGWMRMAMQEWHKSCREGIGRATFLNASSRLASNLARLAGVDVSGKTSRLLAEQQAREEAELRRSRASEKPLWASEQKSHASAAAAEAVTAPTLAPATVCKEQSAPRPVQVPPSAPIKNSYGIAHPAVAADVAQAIKDRLAPSTPAASVPSAVFLTAGCADKPIPKFLDKKVRKRLLALRREEARAETLAAVG